MMVLFSSQDQAQPQPTLASIDEVSKLAKAELEWLPGWNMHIWALG